MKKVYLLKVKQNRSESYLGSISARDLVRLATTQELNESEVAQRPIEPKRLDEIATFVAGDGVIATSIVIGTKSNDKLSVNKMENPSIPGLYYMEFPETDEEFELYKDSFDIMDGQHRLFSFMKERIQIDDSVDYDITFNMYITPTIRERRLIFKNTNEEQKQVASNLLLWFRKQLNMLSDKEKNYHPLVEALNTESCSPLKGRIIMGTEKIIGGFKAEQMINILSKSKIKYLNGELSDEKALKLLSEYLSGWEKAVGSKIKDRDKDIAPFSKISGFRFMILMLPAFFDKAIQEQKSFTKDYVAKTLRELFASESLEPRDMFDPDGDYIKNMGLNPFGGETPTTVIAEEWANKLKGLSSNNYDPLA